MDSSIDSALTRKSADSDLYQEALLSAVSLKKRYAAFQAADPKGFSRIIRKAFTAAFRRKPGPRPDPNVIAAAEERASGAKWPDLYPKYIAFYGEMPPSTKDWAEAGFRRKVNDYRQRDPRLKPKLKARRRYELQRRPADPHP